ECAVLRQCRTTLAVSSVRLASSRQNRRCSARQSLVVSIVATAVSDTTTAYCRMACVASAPHTTVPGRLAGTTCKRAAARRGIVPVHAPPTDPCCCCCHYLSRAPGAVAGAGDRRCPVLPVLLIEQ